MEAHLDWYGVPGLQEASDACPRESCSSALPEAREGANVHFPPHPVPREHFSCAAPELVAGAQGLNASLMDGGALPRLMPTSSGVAGACAARRRQASPELLRCSRRRRSGATEASSSSAAVARRNERERNRVKLVNLGFQALRQHVPHGGANKKLSKVETLRSAVEYIRALQRLLAEHDAVRAALAGGLLTPATPPSDECGNLRYLMKFLALLAEEQDVNKMTPSNIAIVLGPNLLWPPEKEGDQAQLDAASVSSIQVVGVVEALIQNADTLFPGDINFNVSGIFPGLAPQEKVSSQQVSEELPPVTVPAPATTPAPTLAPASMAVRERTEADLPKPTSPKVSRNPTETAASAEDMTRKTKRPAPARPTMPPPQPSSTRSSPPAPSLPPGSVSPGTPQALPRRLVGTSLRAPTMPPPLPPVPPQPARRQSRRLPASPVISNMPAQVDQGVATEDREGPEAVGGHPPPPALPPQPRPRGLISETE